MRRKSDDDDPAFIQPAVDGVGPIFPDQDAVGGDPHRVTIPTQIGRQPLGKFRVLVSVADEYLARIA
jgi:hypothetical protein